MKTFIFLALCSISAFAGPNVSVHIDNQYYQCTPGGTQPSDPNCIPRLATYCDDNTSMTSNECFNQATSACAGQRQGYSDCVISTSEYCDNNTSMTSNECFQKGIAACKGAAQELKDLMEGVKAKALK